MEVSDILHKLEKSTNKPIEKSNKLFISFLKYLGKLKSGMDYEDYLKDNITVPLIEWIIQVLVIRALLLFFCLSVVDFINYPQASIRFLTAEGLSILWFLLVELKQDLWRKS